MELVRSRCRRYEDMSQKTKISFFAVSLESGLFSRVFYNGRITETPGPAKIRLCPKHDKYAA
jgi:hypothetical protein